MHHELLAVVDQDDHVVDHLPRGVIHAQGLRHRAVHILVFNRQGELFLQKRSMLKDLNKGLWDSSAAGHVDADEDYETAAPRELMEELGVNADLQALFKLAPTPDLGMEFIQVYRCRHNGPFQLAETEIDDGIWLTSDAVSERVERDDPTLTVTFKIIWRRYRGQGRTA
ncbi:MULTISPECIES: NUDIX hydrolase [Methylomonas]|uniref:NUDIX hydrolase n=1 Tax=Methylomonas koyamae TaxID=702114 RepID=A0A177P742_9GAMM|nr:NUDIX domain-containing protein [Methylomonas koyamae]OAI25694.1 NUDIX hydrolase [Methylomonas koyamae]